MKHFSLIQLYFVLATMAGLIVLMIGGVSLFRLGLNQLIGVKQYPEFSAPYPPTAERLPSDSQAELTESQRQALEQWEADYQQWQQEQKEYNQTEQRTKRELAEAIAMVLVGVPVFALHAPKVFRKE